MSSDSESDIDYDIQVPTNVKLSRRGRGNELVRNRQTKPKPLHPANENDEEDSSPERSRKSNQKRKSDPHWDDSSSSDDSVVQRNDHRDVVPDSDGEGSGSRGPVSSENQPPMRGGRPKSNNVNQEDSSEEENIDDGSADHPNEGKKVTNARVRKRLSLRRSGAGSIISTAASVASGPKPSPETLKRIYSDCIDMFNSHKITQDNAFQLRFLDLMGDIIDMPDFDKNDMHGAGRTLETGAKIYVCRVDKTKHAVMDLASNLNLQSKRKKQGDGQDEDQEDADLGSVSMREEFDKQKKKKRKRKMKASRFIVENEAKISVVLEDDSTTPAVRRDTLKKMFNAVGDEDMDFDYDAFFYDRPSDHPLANPEEQVVVINPSPVSEAMVNLAQSQKLDFVPFLQVQDFEKFSADLDVWGIPVDPTVDFDEHHRSLNLPDENEPLSPDAQNDDRGMAYNVEERPVDYGPEDLEENNFGNDTFVNEDDLEIDIEGRPVVDIHKIKDLQEFYDMYSKIKSKYGWCGPTFIRPQFNLFSKNAANQGQKKARTRKDPVIFSYNDADWQGSVNKFQTNYPEKTVFDERTIEKWSLGGKCVPPYIGIEDADDELQDLDTVLKVEDQWNENFLPQIFRYFLDPNRNLLEGLQKLAKDEDEEEAHQFHREEDDYIEDAGFEIERHRDSEGFGRDQDVPLDGQDGDLLINMDLNGPFEASFAFPASLGGVLMDTDGDPISKASEVDSIKFTKKPKPIDMHALKRAILKFLKDKLRLEDDGQPKEENETRTELASLVKDICQTVDKKMVEHLSIAIIVVGLMHVVVDKKLFMVLEKQDPNNPRIVCRGKLWKHSENIPLPTFNGFENEAETATHH